jgi:hypothetical protein
MEREFSTTVVLRVMTDLPEGKETQVSRRRHRKFHKAHPAKHRGRGHSTENQQSNSNEQNNSNVAELSDALDPFAG